MAYSDINEKPVWLRRAQFLLVTMMTLARFGLAVLFIQLMEEAAVAYAVATFSFAAVLDFDGYFARLWKVTTPFGAFMDPLADKFLILGAVYGLGYYGDLLVGPSYLGDLWFVWTALVIMPTIVIIIREGAMVVVPVRSLSGSIHDRGSLVIKEMFVFSETSSETRPPVTDTGKIKMAAQCGSLVLLTAVHATVDSGEEWLWYVGATLWVTGLIVYWVGGYLTFITGLDYLRKAVPQTRWFVATVLQWCWTPRSF